MDLDAVSPLILLLLPLLSLFYTHAFFPHTGEFCDASGLPSGKMSAPQMCVLKTWSLACGKQEVGPLEEEVIMQAYGLLVRSSLL